jgi:hypothetical protein
MAITLNGSTGIDTPAIETDSLVIPTQVINGITVGKGGGSASFATAVGYQTLNAANTGSVAGYGYQALYSNTSGEDNTAVGSYRPMYSNTTGSFNTALGRQALQGNTTGNYNTGLGMYALYSNTTASNNTAVGYQAAYANTTGNRLVAIGTASAASNTTGVSNIAIGAYAYNSGTTGNYNTAIGDGALTFNATASNNTAVGYQAGYTLTSGATNNTFIGYQAGYSTITSGSNQFFGYLAGKEVTTGYYNTILGGYNGNQGGLDIRTANNNIVLSDGQGNWGFRVAFATNKSYFNAISSGAGTNALRVSTSTGEITYDTSSARYKDNIRDSVYGLDDVMQLRSAQFEYKDGGRSDVGLIAEEVQLIIPELVGVNKDGLADSVSYDRLVSVCIKAIQELKATVDLQSTEIASLKAQLNNGV